MEVLKPGVYRQPMADYLKVKGISNSGLGTLKRNVPARAKHLIENPEPSTDAQTESTALHTAVFEPHLLEQEYTVADQCIALTQAGTQCRNIGSAQTLSGDWVCGTHARGRDDLGGDRIVLSRKQWMFVTGARDSLFRNAMVKDYLGKLTVVESTIIGARNGFVLKGRQDGRSDALETVLDLKSVNGMTVTASQDSFMWEMFKRGYYRQQGLYRLIERQVGLELPHRLMVVVEKVPPYLCGVYRIMDSVVEAGATEALALTDRWIQYETEGHWPEYPAATQEQDIGLPDKGWDTIEHRAWEDLEAIEEEYHGE